MKYILSLIVPLILWASTSVASEMLSVLIAERAEQEYGYEMPETGQISVSYFNASDFPAHTLLDFYYEKNTGKFLAVTFDEDGKQVKVAGLAIVSVSIPVPTRRIMPNEIILKSDLILATLPLSRVSSFAILDASELLGMQVRRMLAQGRPIPEQSITPPIIVKKGSRVEVIYRDGAMELTAPAKALSDAYLGQEVKVVNLISNKHVVAVASGDGVVEILGK